MSELNQIPTTRISQLPLWAGTQLPPTGMVPFSFGGVTYRGPGSIFPQGEGGGGSPQQIFAGEDEPTFEPDVVPAVYYLMSGDNSDMDENLSGEFFIYIWDGSVWIPVYGYTWGPDLAYNNITPRMRFQRHFMIQEPGGTTGFWSLGQEVAAGPTADSWTFS